MIDYQKAIEKAEEHRLMAGALMSDFLMDHSQVKDNLSREFDEKIALYEHVTKKSDAEWITLMKSQYALIKYTKPEACLKSIWMTRKQKRGLKRNRIFFVNN